MNGVDGRWAALARRHFEARRLDDLWFERDRENGRPLPDGYYGVRRTLLERVARDFVIEDSASGIEAATGARGWPPEIYLAAANELVAEGLVIRAGGSLIPSAFWRSL